MFDTDVCDVQVGCVQLQEKPNMTKKPVGYWYWSLKKAEKTYETTQRECLEVVWSVLLLRPYLEERRFTIRKDYDSLCWILNLIDVSGRLGRWQLHLLESDFDAVHRASVKRQAADALSLLPTDGTDRTSLEDVLPGIIINSVNNELNKDTSHVLEDKSSTITRLHSKPKDFEAPILTGFIKTQSGNAFCRKAANKSGRVRKNFHSTKMAKMAK